QQTGDLLDGLRQFCTATSRSQDGIDGCRTNDLLLSSGVGNEDNVVLVLSPGGLALWFEDTNNTKWYVFNLHHLSHRINTAKQHLPHSVSQYSHFACRIDILRRKPLA